MDLLQNYQCKEVQIKVNHNIKMQFSELFYTNIILALIALCASIIAICYKSKCQKVDICCGVLKIERDIEHEVELDENPRVNQVDPEFRIPHIDDETDHHL